MRNEGVGEGRGVVWERGRESGEWDRGIEGGKGRVGGDGE